MQAIYKFLLTIMFFSVTTDATEGNITWTLEDAVGEILMVKKQLEATQVELRETKESLMATQTALNVAQQNWTTCTVPIDSVYIEYFGQASPQNLWPSLRWLDITSSYAGLFFRALGDGSEGWGINQPECAPRISRMEFYETYSDRFPYQTSIPENGWSDYGAVGAYQHGVNPTRYDESLRFLTLGCEVRPKNQAIRIWKRIA